MKQARGTEPCSHVNMSGRQSQRRQRKKAAAAARNLRIFASPAVAAAYNAVDMLQWAPEESRRRLECNGATYSLECKPASRLLPAELEWAFGLLKDNMHTYYASSDWGWNDGKKRAEMTSVASLYLIARESVSAAPVAFSHFQFDQEDGVDVLYCYEIQLEGSVRRVGLGAALMRTLEAIGVAAHMRKLMLTVFKANTAAVRFYTEKMGYGYDASSPCVCDPEDPDYSYEIMFKLLA